MHTRRIPFSRPLARGGVACALLLAAPAFADTLTGSEGGSIRESVLGTGGGVSWGSSLQLRATLGQPAVGETQNGFGGVLFHGVYGPDFGVWEDGDDDGDTLPNGCEAGTPVLDPYVTNDPLDDPDGDGLTNAEECTLGSDPGDENDPNPSNNGLPVYTPWQGALLMGAIALISMRLLRRKQRRNTQRVA